VRAPARLRQASTELWPLLQQTAAATIAWLVATDLVHHQAPFFAPIAAVVSLNTPLGERGLNALRLLTGVIVGIGTAEIALLALGGGYRTLAVATFVAMFVARALHPARIVTAQAAAGAILTVSTADGQVGPQRLVDALIGAGVALAFSQLLFPPRPLALVRRAEAAALAEMAAGLNLAARALELDDDELAAQALGRLRALRNQLGELARSSRASSRITRHSVWWRSQRRPVVEENENAGHLDLLGGSCLTLVRTALGGDPGDEVRIEAALHDLSGRIGAIARDPGNRSTRQRAADGAADLADRLTRDVAPSALPAAARVWAVRQVAADIIVFAGGS